MSSSLPWNLCMPNRSMCVLLIVCNSCVTDSSSFSIFVYSSCSFDNLVAYTCNCSVKCSSLLCLLGSGGVNTRKVGRFLTDRGTVQGNTVGISLSWFFLESWKCKLQIYVYDETVIGLLILTNHRRLWVESLGYSITINVWNISQGVLYQQVIAFLPTNYCLVSVGLAVSNSFI